MKIKFLLLLLLPFLFSCNEKKDIKIERAFYKWDGNSIYGPTADKLRVLNVQKIYFKFFEVDYSEVRGNFPIDKNQPYGLKTSDSIEIIPTIFIRNEIFQFNDEKMLDRLADNIVYLVNKYCKSPYGNSEATFSYNEIQIDCDWTKSTKEKYFYLLKKIKQLSKKKLSCTLRLYPYAYPDVMGVPPVDKAMLMCYNLIKPLSQKQKNSILDVPELNKYLKQTNKYPLHLDIALPVFFWSQWYQNNHFVKLLDLSSKELSSFTKQLAPMWYEVTKDTVVSYVTYLKTGDRIKCEEVSTQELLKAIELLKKNVRLEGNVTVSLFNLSEGTFKKYSDEEINSVYNNLGQ